jgi:hypothetical protein
MHKEEKEKISLVFSLSGRFERPDSISGFSAPLFLSVEHCKQSEQSFFSLSTLLIS